MLDFKKKDRYTYDDLVSLVALLRGEGGCAWDQAQTHTSIRRNFLEETLEACEAMDENSPAHLCEELGDVLLQVVFHAGIEADAGHFTMEDVCDGVCKKLIDRHPHLFSDATQPPDWEQLKRSLRGEQTVAQAMQAVSGALPAQWRAEKILQKAEKAGFCWNDPAQSVEKLKEEITELEAAVQTGDGCREELGDVLFAAVSAARQLHIDPEDALNSTCKKFTDRFAAMEAAAALRGVRLEDMDRQELAGLWANAKAACKKQ